VIIYRFTEEGPEKARLYKKQVHVDLERSRALIEKGIKDNF